MLQDFLHLISYQRISKEKRDMGSKEWGKGERRKFHLEVKNKPM